MKQGLTGAYKDLVFWIKENVLVRALAYPYCTWKRNLQTKNYAASQESKRIRKWKNLYDGKRCFIIGNGPSLKAEDLERLKDRGEITFSSNRIYHIYDRTEWRPDFYVAFEPEFCKTNADMISKIEVKTARFLNIAAWSSERRDPDTFWMNCTLKYSLKKLSTENIRFSEDISVCVNDAYSVTYTMLQLAMYMGFDEIYLLGVDHYDRKSDPDSQHFYRREKNEYQTPTYIEGIEYGYRLAYEEAEKRGISIFNASRGGSLEVYPRVDFDSVF